ncbi:MAG: methyltransferase domain-containing protein [Nitrospiraceae bacterium]
MSKETTAHHQAIIDQFTKQAVPFAAIPGHMDALQLLIQLSRVSSADDVLDVACGPGIVACAVAPHARAVTGIDLTLRMIEQARQLQGDKKLENISWQVGDVVLLPFPDATFSLVLTRYSFHHFEDPAAVLSEMMRVCRPGGRVMVVDVVLPLEKVDAYNQMEKLRDPSHTRALSYPEMASVIEASGLSNVNTARYSVEMELERQLQASFPNPGDADKIREMFVRDIGYDAMGVGANRQGEEIHFAYPVLVVIGEKHDG